MFDEGVKLWTKRLGFNHRYWQALYRVDTMAALYFFHFGEDTSYFKMINRVYKDAERYYFEGSRLIELIDYDWYNHPVEIV